MKLNDDVNGYKVVGISKTHTLFLKDGAYRNVPLAEVKEFISPKKVVKKPAAKEVVKKKATPKKKSNAKKT